MAPTSRKGSGSGVYPCFEPESVSSEILAAAGRGEPTFWLAPDIAVPRLDFAAAWVPWPAEPRWTMVRPDLDDPAGLLRPEVLVALEHGFSPSTTAWGPGAVAVWAAVDASKHARTQLDRLCAAAWVDLGHCRTTDVAEAFSIQQSKASTRLTEGRRLLAQLGAWPWFYFGLKGGRLPQDWHSDELIQASFHAWTTGQVRAFRCAPIRPSSVKPDWRPSGRRALTGLVATCACGDEFFARRDPPPTECNKCWRAHRERLAGLPKWPCRNPPKRVAQRAPELRAARVRHRRRRRRFASRHVDAPDPSPLLAGVR